ncbi:hypothetical protein GCM10010193_33140 [Kitasatospora atroaurantiaca]|uniref:Sugar lactone lactonase YvrE n=1 Tax=Kitasatospora atroaurantiaca TaxID=285545 RepID=A0A561ERQ6_9ACTN|nr:hypothetical protein FB465_3351 [Kitasatospora atroaurantiaca]
MIRVSRTAGLIVAAGFALAVVGSSPAVAVAPPLSEPRIVKHFDLAAGQTPENIALEPDGSADLTFIGNRQIAHVTLDGEVHILATLPAPATQATPIVGYPAVAGIVRVPSGTLYFTYSTGTSDLTGIWRLKPGGTPERIVALPTEALLNGLALDERHHVLYATDSAVGVVRRVPLNGEAPTVWATGSELERTNFIGANGLKIHHGAVWVSNLDKGTLLRVPIRDDGSAGPIEVRTEDLVGIDDFTFVGHTDDIIAAVNFQQEVVYVTPDGAHTTVLAREDGVSNPTAVALCGDTVYVTSAAFTTMHDPNLLLARLRR